MDDTFNFPERPDSLEQPRHMAVQPSTEFTFQIIRGTRAEVILAARGAIPVESDGVNVGEYLYVYGHVTYTDAFRELHTLLYCAEYKPPSNISPESWTACPHHNEEYEGRYKPQ